MIHDMIDHASYMAHGYCLLWKPWLVVLHAGSDLLIFAAYFAIPAAIWIFLRQRPDLELRPLAILFAAFIFLVRPDPSRPDGDAVVADLRDAGLPQGADRDRVGRYRDLIFPLIPKAVAHAEPARLANCQHGLRRGDRRARGYSRATCARLVPTSKARVAERTRELERAKARLEALIKASAQIFWTTSPDGQVMDDSPTWRAFTGQSYDQWRGAGWLNAIHPDDRPLALAAWREAVANKTTYNVEYRIKEADGDYRWTNARGVPLFEPDGTLSEWVGMNEDISAREARRAALQPDHARAVAPDQELARRDFIPRAAHVR